MEDQPSHPKPTPQDQNQPQNPTEQLDTFGEKILVTTPKPADHIPLDEYGNPMFHEHDEFGEWLTRNPDY